MAVSRETTEYLGKLLNSQPYANQCQDLKDHLDKFRADIVPRLINAPIKRYSGQTTVHLAARNGLWECLELLLKNGGNPNIRSSQPDLCQTPLHIAARKGYAKCLQILLDYGARMDIETTHREKPLQLVQGKFRACEKVFEHAIAKFQIPRRSQQQEAVVNGLHNAVVSGDQERFYALYGELQTDHRDLATRWTDLFERTLLYTAAETESLSIVQFLLSKSLNQPLHNLNSYDTPLLVACRKNNHKLAEMLLNHSPQLLFNQEARSNRSALHFASSVGDLKMVGLILDHVKFVLRQGDYSEENKLSLDFLDNLGRTPLFNACYYGHTEIVQRLIEFYQHHPVAVSLDVNVAVKNSQRTPLHVAVKRGSSDIVRILLSSKEVDLHLEAKPSKDTHKQLIRAVQKKLHGRVMPAHSIIEEDYEPDRMRKVSNHSDTLPPESPTPISMTPISSSSTSWSNIASPIPSGSDTPESDEAPPPQQRQKKNSLDDRRFTGASSPPPPLTSPVDRNAFTLPKQLPPFRKSSSEENSGTPVEEDTSNLKKRSQTNFVIEDNTDTTIAVYETSSKHLEILTKGTYSGHTVFDNIFMTALAEACVYNRQNLIIMLLKHGARDETGLACRIAHLAQRPALVQLILAHHCVLGERKSTTKKVQQQQQRQTNDSLKLEWSNLKLASCDDILFTNPSVYYPSRENSDHDFDTGYSTKPRDSRKLQRMGTIYEQPVKCISVVNLNNNHLTEVPLSLFQLENVTEINLAYNQLPRLPESFDPYLVQDDFCGWQCADLEDLNICHNAITIIPACVWVLPSLKRLHLAHNKLEFLLPERGKKLREELLTDTLVHVDLSNNSLASLPQFLFKFCHLRTLCLHRNSLRTLPETLWLCSTLQDLNLAHNKLSSLPWCEPENTLMESQSQTDDDQTRPFKNFEHSVLGHANVQLKRSASGFNRQESTFHIAALEGKHDIASDIPLNALEGCDYSSMTKLILAHNNLELFPEALPCLAPNLIEIDVSNNPLTEINIQFIPPYVKKFTADHCKIERFGNTITEALHTQVVKNCRHPETFATPCQHRSHYRLASLTKLSLSSNKLKYFQLIYRAALTHEGEDAGMREMEFHNSITSLDLLYPSLETLDLSQNNLQGIFNPNIGHQSHLKSIRLDKNYELERLPMEFAYLKNTRLLTELSRRNLPKLVDPPKEYQDVNLNHLLAYMRSRLKESVYHRTIKLFFIGDGERGKTTLLRRLRSLPSDKSKVLERTTGIDIEEWTYRPKKGRGNREPVKFLAWDFAGQGVYHTTHQCFYSRRSLYLALFKLTDDHAGICELEQWLRNVKLRAPGSPVIIVGTYLDSVTEVKAKELEEAAIQKYNDTSIYPKIITAISVSSTKRFLFNDPVEDLRELIYDVACHLQLTIDGISLEYKPQMDESDPKALFSQLIPKTFLNLQDAIRQKVLCFKERKEPPIMAEENFFKTFKNIFEDEEELNEAVFCLNLQGTLLHFEDHGLRNFYFLDPQWLAKLMADVIRPAAMEEGSPIQNGKADINTLFTQRHVPQSYKDMYVSLLQKFDVALLINQSQVIIPSLMRESANYPKTSEVLSDIESSVSLEHYPPSLRRFCFSNFIPEGFWPRLICRIANDQQIGKILLRIIGGEQPLYDQIGRSPSSSEGKDILDWIPWKTGIAFAHKGRTLLVLKQESNVPCEMFFRNWAPRSLKRIEAAWRIEIHIHTDDWIKLVITDRSDMVVEETEQPLNPRYITGLATRLLIMILQHVESVATVYFPGMLVSHHSYKQAFPTYLPCWKCYGEIGLAGLDTQAHFSGHFICKNSNPVHCFDVNEKIVSALREENIECSIHGRIKVHLVAPDLVFWDLATLYEEDQTSQLEIFQNEILGKGGYGFVCKGRLVPQFGKPKNVAIKFFLHGIENLVDQCTIQELLDHSNEPKHLLFGYREIRQEVSFLATLSSPFLTDLCGVRTTPYLCLLLELAPKKSLKSLLKEYRERQVMLEPLTLKNTARQIAKGLEYIHRHQVVHLDMKSPNVLVWHFPSPNDSRSIRLRQAGNVWIKIADYGISQVSTGLTLRVGNNPPGTPGFLAPEMFDKAGQEISAEKVDVFAYGMTLYEMLSLRAPFDNVQPAVKRHQEVRERERPSLQAKETRSLLLFQELMALCWNHEPDDRPRMKQVCNWVESPEFERLRSEVSLKDVKSVSCACVCRILPENEDEVSPNSSLPRTEKKIAAPMFRISEESDVPENEGQFGSYMYEDDDDFGDTLLTADLEFKQYHHDPEPPGLKSLYHHSPPGRSDPRSAPNPFHFDPQLCDPKMGTSNPTNLGPPNVVPLAISPERAGGLFDMATTQGGLLHQNGKPGSHHFSNSPAGVRRNVLLTMPSEDDQGIEATGNQEMKFLPSKSSNSSHGDKEEDGDCDDINVGVMNAVYERYTQIWLCGKDQRKGLLQIFTYKDRNPGRYTFNGYCSSDEVTAMCPVRNAVWIGTSTGTLKVFHAPTLKTKFNGKLQLPDQNPSFIIDMRHIAETSTVLVANANGDIWSLYDRVETGGIQIQNRIELSDLSPCYHLVKVNEQGRVEVWGTMERNRLLILERSPSSSLSTEMWTRSELKVEPGNPKLQLCSYIVHTSFTAKSGAQLSHIWVSYRHRSILVSFDVKTRTQRCVLNCADTMRSKDDTSFQVTTLLAHDRKIFVGTTSGYVGIFDSETRQLLNTLAWHKDKVRTLLAMPKETEPCICAEIPFPKQEPDSDTGLNPESAEPVPDDTDGKRTKMYTKVHTQQSAKKKSQFLSQRGMSAFTYLENRYYIPNTEPDAVMITSVGSGRRTYTVHEQTKAEKLEIFENTSRTPKRSRSGKNRSTAGEDVVLLTWRS